MALQVVFVILLAIATTTAAFNLYLSTQEMKRLLGLENELYYVTEGRVNKYAMGFVIPVPTSVSELHFTWHSGAPPSPTYHLATSSSHPAALATPRVNISRAGAVPSSPQVWRLSLHCTGAEAAEVVVTLDIRLTGLDPARPNNVTELKFRRKKTCFFHEVIAPVEQVEEAPGRGVPTYVVFFAGVGGCLVVLIVVLTLVIATWLRTTKPDKAAGQAANTTQYSSVPPDSMQNNSGLQDRSGGSPGAELGACSASSLPPGHHLAEGRDYAEVALAIPVVDRLSLTLGDLLLEGTFGRIYQGRLARAEGSVDVMVKTIVTGSSRAQADKLVREGSLLHPAPHRQLLAILASTSDGSSPIMIYEYLSPGNLKKWLQSCHQSVSTHQAVSLGLQLLAGLKHLHRRQLLHGDVAARNCFLSSIGGVSTVKLCDPALSRDLFPGDYHCLGDNENRPVKWFSLDTLQTGEVTMATDVWAWGVTMWEILTRAQQPFPDVDPGEMGGYLTEGFRLHQPVNCPDQLYTVMVSYATLHYTTLHNTTLHYITLH